MKSFSWTSILACLGAYCLAGCSTATALVGAAPGKVDAPGKADPAVGIHPGGIGTSAYRGFLLPKKGDELAIFAMGCFWGTEADFRKVKGVVATAVGFTGGTTPNPSYELVCTGRTHHAEAALIEYDPTKVTYSQLLEVFWASHDPTTLNQQGPDQGEQYRSAIFYLSPKQKELAESTREQEQKSLDQKIVTQIVPAGPFYMAELYHQQYGEKTGHDACPPPRRATNGVPQRSGG